VASSRTTKSRGGIAVLGRGLAGPALRTAAVPRVVAEAQRTGVCVDIQRYSIHDGPGIRTTVFLKGCPLACLWCHNPESIARAPELRVLAGRCVRCGACTKACPLGLADGPNLPDPARCLRCGSCAAACPTGARQLTGRAWTVQEVLDAVLRDRPFYDDSGGGVTFSGGEPLTQWRFLLACLEAAQAQGLHTAVDTSGFASLAVIRAVATRTNLFLYDLKVLDPERHLRFTGVPLAPILRNLRALDATGARIWLRMPLVPGYNDDRANLEAVGTFAAGLRHARRLHLLPYHRLGAEKYARLGRADPMGDVPSPTSDTIETAARILRAYSLDVHVGG
jgi:pyruvate formate lyase activating enzyme